MKVLQGVGISPGIAIGPAFVFEPPIPAVAESRCADPEQEIVRLSNALRDAALQIDQLAGQAQAALTPEIVSLFTTQKLFLQDIDLLDRVHALITGQRFTAEYAWFLALQEFESLLSALQVEVFAQRSVDLRDAGQRVLQILLGKPLQLPLSRPSILVTDELTPSVILSLDRAKLLGFCTVQGSPTSHVAILSKAMQVPAAAGIFATGVEGLNGQIIVLDGQAGTVLIDSDPQTLERYRALALEDRRKAEQHLQKAAQPAFSKDNHLFLINANISSLDEAQTAFGRYGADGIGLFRTEYLFLGRKKPPSEEEQYQYYLSILEHAGGKPVTARTVDLGGDKTVDYLATADEANPFLGLRGTRLALANAQLLRDQICALLRAGAIGHLKIMFPLISTVPEAKQAKMLVEECKSELRRRNLPFNPDIQTGVMIETPASAVMVDFLLQEFDFCSIGTNDLVQYTLAADRTNPVVAGYADAMDPAMIRLIAAIIRTAHQAGKPVSLCGELAADPTAVTLLAGLGLDEFSLNAPGIPLIKDRTRAVSLTEARQIAARALTLPSAVEVRAYLLSEGMR